MKEKKRSLGIDEPDSDFNSQNPSLTPKIKTIRIPGASQSSAAPSNQSMFSPYKQGQTIS